MRSQRQWAGSEEWGDPAGSTTSAQPWVGTVKWGDPAGSTTTAHPTPLRVCLWAAAQHTSILKTYLSLYQGWAAKLNNGGKEECLQGSVYMDQGGHPT